MSSRLVLFAARWGMLFGFAGLVCAALVFFNRGNATAESQRRLLLVSAAMLSLAFVLAPFVRNAFVGNQAVERQRTTRKTLLEEMKEQGDDVAPTQPPAMPPSSAMTARLLTTLYLLFGAVLAAVLWAL